MSTDLRLVIESMQHTIEFENELHRRYPPVDQSGEETKGGDNETRRQVRVSGGKVEITASGNADDIRAKYLTPSGRSESGVAIDTTEQNNANVFDRMQAQAKLENKSKITKRTYKFEGQISQAFEPYLQTYSE